MEGKNFNLPTLEQYVSILVLQISNWTGNQFYDRRVMMKYGNLYGAGGTQYAYYHEEDESSFQLVDTAKSLRPNFGRGRFQRGRGGADRGGRGGQNQRPGAMQVLGGKNQKMDQRYVECGLKKTLCCTLSSAVRAYASAFGNKVGS